VTAYSEVGGGPTSENRFGCMFLILSNVYDVPGWIPRVAAYSEVGGGPTSENRFGCMFCMLISIYYVPEGFRGDGLFRGDALFRGGRAPHLGIGGAD
jgi:hypothetical protein